MTTIQIERTLHKYAIPGLILCSLLIAGYIRLIGVSDDFTSLIGADSARYVHQAQQILEHGRMPAVDTLRVAPLGQATSTQLTLYSYVIAALCRVAQVLRVDIERFVIIFTCVVIHPDYSPHLFANLADLGSRSCSTFGQYSGFDSSPSRKNLRRFHRSRWVCVVAFNVVVLFLHSVLS